jgi:large subunit ribosomal protein L16
MLLPKRTKFRRVHRGRLKGIATKSNTVVFGDFGIQALEPVWLTSRQIEATRRSITRYVRRTGKIWIRVFPDKPITERPAETRMGSGKGAPEYWVAVVKPGTMLFEINGLEKSVAYKVLRTASYKLPIKTKIVERANAKVNS